MAGDALLLSSEYRNHLYGIKNSAFKKAQDHGQVPLLTITPESTHRLAGFDDARSSDRQFQLPEFVSIFIDAPDPELDARLRSRDAGLDLEEVLKGRETDRKWKDSCTYVIRNSSTTSASELIASLWEHSGHGGIVPARLIRLMLDCGVLLTSAVNENISGASYDLSLGDEYFSGGKFKRLSDIEPILLIEPYDYAIVTSNEAANFPRDVSGRFDLSVSLFCQGIILSNGPQVDPGFKGPLFCLLLNTSSSPVFIKRRQHYATIEFHKLLEPTRLYVGQYRSKTLLDYLPTNAATGAINELKKELERVRQESTKLRDLTWAFLAVVLAILALWATFLK